MGQTLAALVYLIFPLAAQAQLFSTAGEKVSAIDRVVEGLTKLDVSKGTATEDYSALVGEGERTLDGQRQQCLEMSSNRGGQQCVRDVVKGQRRLIEVAHGAKRRLLSALHERQLRQLDETRDEALKRLDKEF